MTTCKENKIVNLYFTYHRDLFAKCCCNANATMHSLYLVDLLVAVNSNKLSSVAIDTQERVP